MFEFDWPKTRTLNDDSDAKQPNLHFYVLTLFSSCAIVYKTEIIGS